jgi:hypothetical protein
MASTTQIRMTAAEFAALPETNLPTELIHGELITMTAVARDAIRAIWQDRVSLCP